MAVLTFLALIAVQAASIPANPIVNGRIIGHSPRPAAGSGVFHFMVAYTVETPDRTRHLLYQTYFGADDHIAPPGSLCTIRFRQHPGETFVHAPHEGEEGQPHLMVDEISCDSDLTGRPATR